MRKAFLFRMFDENGGEEVDKVEFRNVVTMFIEVTLNLLISIDDSLLQI